MALIERTKFFVNSLAQGRLMLRFAGYWVVYHIVLWHTLFLFRFFEYRFQLMMGNPPQTFAELYGGFCAQYYPIVFSAVAVLPLLLWDMLKMTHRIVGPLIRFQRAIEALQRGERLEEVTLRTGDLLIEYQIAFNQFLKYYNNRIDTLEAQLAAAPLSGNDVLSNRSEFSLPEADLLQQVEELRDGVEAAVETATAE